MKSLAVLPLVLLVTLASCATSIFPRQDGYFWGAVPPEAVFSLKDLAISTKPTTGNLKQTATDLAYLAARKAGLRFDVPDAEAPRYSITIGLEEREFGVDIDTFNSVSVVLKVYADGDKPVQVGQVVYAEETKKTLRSANYLAQVLETLFDQLSRRLKANP